MDPKIEWRFRVMWAKKRAAGKAKKKAEKAQEAAR